jgi:hypothetical protein
VILPIEATCPTFSGRRQPFAIHISTRTTSAVPAATDERKNDTGSTGDHHCGASCSFMRR